MNKMRLLSAITVLLIKLYFAKALEEDALQLRGAITERETLFLCNSIEMRFNGAVQCICNYNVIFGRIGFTCETREARCQHLPGTGDMCGRTRFEGRLIIQWTQLAATIEVKSCQKDVWANNTHGGDVFIGDICFQVDFGGRILGGARAGVSKCQAIYGAGADQVTCTSCQSCKFAGNRTGVKLDCNNLQVVPDPCFPFEIGIFIPPTARLGSDLNIDSILDQVDLLELTSGAAMNYTLNRVAEEIEQQETR